ncbi:MAG TPA: tetratricopeptide repeat-containing sensor histidine kinase [Saprospiraceae bacterium]|nr:tetratricopeptide repeat-containing sensor histidine kinase [Saprospiraceae bacterium]
MKRLFYLFAFALLLTKSLHAQNDPDAYIMDSLQLMIQHARPGADKVDVLLGLARQSMLKGNSPRAMEYAKQALPIAEGLGNLDLQSECLNFISQIDYNQGGDYYTSSRKAMDLAIQSGSRDATAFTTYIWVEFGDYSPERGIDMLDALLPDSAQISPKNLGNIYKTIAWEYEKNGQFAEAEDCYRKSIRIFESFKSAPPIDARLGRVSAQYADHGLANLLQSHLYLGALLMKMGKYREAIDEGETGLQIAEQTNASDVAYAQMYLGDFNATAGDISEALKRYELSKKLYEALTDKKWIGRVLIRLGNLFYTTLDYDQALHYFNQAYEIIKSFSDEAADLTLRIGRVYEMQENTDLALKMYVRADSIYLSVGDTLSSFESKIQLAKLYSNTDDNQYGKNIILGLLPKLQQIRDAHLLQSAFIGLANIEENEGNYQEAIYHAKQALEVAEQYGIAKSGLQSAHLLLSHLYELNGNYSEALQHQKTYQAYKDSVFTENSQQLLKQEQVKQQVDKHRKEKEQAEAYASLLKQQNIAYLIASIILAILLALGTYLFIQLRKTRSMLQAQNETLQNLNHTKDRFFSIIAHDLRSPMVALESVDQQMAYFLGKGDHKKVEKIAGLVGKTTHQLAALLDNLLNWARQQLGVIPYHPEHIRVAKAFEEVISIYASTAMQKEIIIRSWVDSDCMVFADKNALHTLLRNLLSNALKFSFTGQIIELEAKSMGDSTQLSIVDQGEGMNQDQLIQLFELTHKSTSGTYGERGTGLGLVLCKDLVEQNKGTIDVVSEKGHGTRITVILPAKS